MELVEVTTPEGKIVHTIVGPVVDSLTRFKPIGWTHNGVYRALAVPEEEEVVLAREAMLWEQ